MSMDDKESKKLKLFRQLKQATLGREDLSIKGSIDEPIRPLVTIVNNSEFYYTTSTCSGRITLTEKPLGRSNIKRGNKFHYSSHEPVAFQDLSKVISSYRESSKAETKGEDEDVERCLWFKYEPFIVHVQCFDLEKARSMLNLANSAGCRNSGITLGKPDKFMLAMRSTSSMEVPVYCDTRFEVSDSYIEFLCEESNRRMLDNSERLSQLQNAIESFLKSKEDIGENNRVEEK